jgi:hypothetical protein
MLKKTVKILFCLLAGSWLIFGNYANATLPSPLNPCTVDEKLNFTCGEFGQSTIRFLGTKDGVCGTEPCTVYYYKYEGPALSCPLWKLVDVAIPLKLTGKVGNVAVHCDKYFTTGTGDNLNYFWGSGFFDLGICRIIPSDPGADPIEGANFYIAADPSYPDKTKPLNWAMRNLLLFYTARIVGPASLASVVAPAAPTEVNLTSVYGKTCKYQIIGGNLTLLSCDGGNYNLMKNVKLCQPCTDEGFTFQKDSVNFCCQNLLYITENADIGLTGSDPCRSVGGGLLCW